MHTSARRAEHANASGLGDGPVRPASRTRVAVDSTATRHPVRWHLLTGEYPPTTGGVADFTSLIARELARAGASVDVWHAPGALAATPQPGVRVHAVAGGFSAQTLRALSHALSTDRETRLLVQWVPHAFGWRSMNVPFVAWLAWRAWVHGDAVEIVAHEPGLAWEGGVVHRAVSVVHRMMAALLVHSARRIWVSTPSWETRLRPLALGRRRDFRWLPIPNVIPVVATAAEATALRARLEATGLPLIVHFGTYGSHHLEQLEDVFRAVLAGEPRCRLVLAGPGGERLSERLRARTGGDASTTAVANVITTGALDPATLSALLTAADVVVQPFTDGISARRTSAMAPLAHGCVVVSTHGALTEPMWLESGAVALAPADQPEAVARAVIELLGDDDARNRMRATALSFYESRFAIRRAVGALLGEDGP